MIYKNVNEVFDSITDVITNKYPLINEADIKPDSLLGAMMGAVALEIQAIYNKISQVELNNRISTANKSYLDLIGNSIGATRQAGQDDDSYRYTIVNWVRNNRTASLSAVEEAIRNTEGIYTYYVDNLAYGAGTFAVHVQTQDAYNSTSVLENLYNNINEVVAEGVLFKIITPKEVKIDVDLMVLGDIASSSAALKLAVRTYISSIKPGESLYVNKLESIAMTSSTSISSVYVTSIRLNGKQMYAKEAKLLIDEQFRISDNNITITK